MSQRIPISFTSIPVPLGTQASTWDQLISVVSKYLQGSITTDVSFFIQGSTPPVSDQGIFFNKTSNQFQVWNAAYGRYMAITQSVVGDIKASYVAGDDTAGGWIQLDGRKTDEISGINSTQQTNLETLFGISSDMPNYNFLSGLTGLPNNTSFSGITNPSVNPVNGVIGALAISPTYNNIEVQALRDNTEVLDKSVITLQSAVATSIATSEKVLQVLNSVVSGGPVWKVYVGMQ